MTKILQRVEMNLRSFYIFNTAFGKDEGDEDKKIVYYHPKDIEQNTKIKDVGLSEAIISFTNTFTDNDKCKALHTQKTTQLFLQPEPGFWMVLVINVPKEIRTKDGIEVAEYRGSEVVDHIYRAVLQECYNNFRLFKGSFRMVLGMQENDDIMQLDDQKQQQLRNELELFFEKHLQTIKLPACDVMNMIRSTQYLPLNKILFLRTHNFINLITEIYKNIADVLLLHDEQVVSSGKINSDDLVILLEYITNTLLPKALPPTEQGASVNLVRSNSISTDYYRNGLFVTGPETESTESSHVPNCIKPPKVFLRKENTNQIEAYYMIVYRALNAVMCCFINANEEPQQDFYNGLHSDIGQQLASISREIDELASKSTKGKTSMNISASDISPTTPKYLYINEQSLQHVTNITFDKRLLKCSQNVPFEVMNIIADLENMQNKRDSKSIFSPMFEEVLMKTTSDFWIVKRRCNWRHYYVIIFNSKATLLDVTQEAKRIFDQEFTDDVFFDK